MRDDYNPAGGLSRYSLPDNLCQPDRASADSVSYRQINTDCGTIGIMNAWHDEIVKHEREHEEGFDQCLTGATGQQLMASLENLYGPAQQVLESATALMNQFVDRYANAGLTASGVVSGTFWYNNYSSTWYVSTIEINAESGGSGC